MNAGDLLPNDDRGQAGLTSNEVQFALVIAGMIDTLKNSPEDLRQAVYDLKLQEQFTHADAKGIRRAQQALETAIHEVEQFSREQVNFSRAPSVSQLDDGTPSWLRRRPFDLSSPIPYPLITTKPGTVARRADHYGRSSRERQVC